MLVWIVVSAHTRRFWKQGCVVAGNALELPPPISPLPTVPSPFPGDSPGPQMPEHYLRELLHMMNWTN